MALVYFTAMLLGNAVAMPLGGIFNALLGLSMAIPYAGRVLALLFNRMIRVTLLGKLAAWSISASGLVLTYLLVAHFKPPQGNPQWLAVTAAAAIVVLNHSWRIVMFQPIRVPTVPDIQERLPHFISLAMSKLDEDEKLALMQQTFTDVNYTALLQFLVAFGMLLFGLTHLHWLKIQQVAKPTIMPSLVDCLASAFSLQRFVDGQPVVFVGARWLVLRFAGGVVLLIWSMRFIGYAAEVQKKQAEAEQKPETEKRQA
jgi:hypothetical protein